MSANGLLNTRVRRLLPFTALQTKERKHLVRGDEHFWKELPVARARASSSSPLPSSFLPTTERQSQRPIAIELQLRDGVIPIVMMHGLISTWVLIEAFIQLRMTLCILCSMNRADDHHPNDAGSVTVTTTALAWSLRLRQCLPSFGVHPQGR